MEPPRGSATAVAWLNELRSRFLAVARRRVPPGAAEDLVQEAFRVLAEKGALVPGAVLPGGTPAVAYGFRVLRNVIGNYYQRERARRNVFDAEAGAPEAADAAPLPIEALVAAERVRILRESLADMTVTDGDCARYLLALLEGDAPRDLAHREGVEEAVLYRRLYRCRHKLRERIARRGIDA